MMVHRYHRSHMFVAKVDNRVVGFANFPKHTRAGKVDLTAMYLLPPFQENGIGTALLQQGIDALDNVKEIYIDVEKENKTGRTFYEAKGFTIVDEYEEDFNGHMLQTVRMMLTV